MRHETPKQPEGVVDAPSCWEYVREFVVVVVVGQGGCPLQVWTYLASGYSDDKICGAGDLTVVFREKHVRTRRV